MLKFRAVLMLIVGLFIVSWAGVEAAPGDTTADAVLGQGNFTGSLPNGGGNVNAAGLEWPYGMVVDPVSGRLFMADFKNNRVLSWPNAESFTNGSSADIVLGQSNFTSGEPNRGGAPAANTLNGPVGLTIDRHTGRLFVAEYLNNRVVTYPSPITTGMAADVVYGQPDFTSMVPNNGGITNATLKNPWSVSLDSQGQLYVSDYGNNRILVYHNNFYNQAFRVFGQPSTITGTPNNGGISASSLSSPAGIHIPTVADILIVADSNNNRVLIYDLDEEDDEDADIVLGQDGSFTTNLPNKGGLGPKSLWLPTDITFDSGHSLYVADRNNSRVLHFPVGDTISDVADQVFGQPNFTSNTINNGGIGPNSMDLPYALTVTPGDFLLVSDRSNNRVLRYDLPQPNSVPQLVNIAPTDVAIGGPSFKLYVSGSNFTPLSKVTWNGQIRPTTYLNASEIQAVIPASDIATDFTGTIQVVNPPPGGGTSVGQLTVNDFIATPRDNTADRVIGQPNFQSNTWNNWQVGGLGPRSLNRPYDVTIDPASGRIYAADASNYRVLSWPSSAAFTNAEPADFIIGQPNMYSEYFGGFSNVNASTLNIPLGVAVDTNSNVYVADTLNNRVLVYLNPTATDTVADFVFGQPNFTTATENTGGISSNSLNGPYDVVLDADGTLYIDDEGNNRILVFYNPLTSDRTADIVIGQPTFNTGDSVYNPTATNLAAPRGIAVDTDGRLYVADYVYNRVVAYDAPLTNGAAADFVFGQPDFTSRDENNGGVSAYSMRAPHGVVVDNAGNVYISDFLNSRILGYIRPIRLNDKKADYVFGQPNFSTIEGNQGGDPTAKTLQYPSGLVIGPGGDLFVADQGNHRLLNYDSPLQAKFATYLPATLK